MRRTCDLFWQVPVQGHPFVVQDPNSIWATGLEHLESWWILSHSPLYFFRQECKAHYSQLGKNNSQIFTVEPLWSLSITVRRSCMWQHHCSAKVRDHRCGGPPRPYHRAPFRQASEAVWCARLSIHDKLGIAGHSWPRRECNCLRCMPNLRLHRPAPSGRHHPCWW